MRLLPPRRFSKKKLIWKKVFNFQRMPLLSMERRKIKLVTLRINLNVINFSLLRSSTKGSFLEGIYRAR
jgi:hypothetical protein